VPGVRRRDFDDIVVMDTGSHDRTVEIAGGEALGARAFIFRGR